MNLYNCMLTANTTTTIPHPSNSWKYIFVH